jgi:hypothetical protein
MVRLSPAASGVPPKIEAASYGEGGWSLGPAHLLDLSLASADVAPPWLRRIAVKRRRPNPWFKRGTVYRRAVDVLRTATEPLTAREIAERVLAAAKMTNPNKAALADLTGTIKSSLKNHDGKGVQRTNEGSPARWRLASKE